jgi:hypothetical protein
MQHLEHTLHENFAFSSNKEAECRIMESNLNRDPGASNINISISYWLVVQELLNSYNTAIPSFAQQAVLTGADAHETGIINEVN